MPTGSTTRRIVAREGTGGTVEIWGQNTRYSTSPWRRNGQRDPSGMGGRQLAFATIPRARRRPRSCGDKRRAAGFETRIPNALLRNERRVRSTGRSYVPTSSELTAIESAAFELTSPRVREQQLVPLWRPRRRRHVLDFHSCQEEKSPSNDQTPGLTPTRRVPRSWRSCSRTRMKMNLPGSGIFKPPPV